MGLDDFFQFFVMSNVFSFLAKVNCFLNRLLIMGIQHESHCYDYAVHA